jgi:hypothetical protein
MVQEKMGKVLRVGGDNFGRVQKDIERNGESRWILTRYGSYKLVM